VSGVKPSPHRCTGACRCPVHGTPLIYWPAGEDHACQDAGCEYGQGFKAAEIVDPSNAVRDAQAILMFRQHPDLKNLGRRP